MSDYPFDSPRADTVYFSRQLFGWLGHSLFIAVGLLTATSLVGSFSASVPALLVMLMLLTVYMVLGTVGWRKVFQQHSTRSVYRYFLVQFAFAALLMLSELTMDVKGLSTSILGIGFMIQVSVLPVRLRLWYFGGLLLLIALIYTPSMRTGFDLQQTGNLIVIFGAIYSAGAFIGTLIVREDRARETSQRLDESNRKLAQYAAEVEALSTVAERNRLAREIHDNLGHYLTAVNMQLEVALMTLPQESEPAKTAVSKAQTLTKEALSEIRRSISALRATPIENRTLNEAIALLVEQHRATGNTINFQLLGTVQPCSAPIEMTFYRIAQEGLTNVRKHAAGSTTTVILSYLTAGRVSLEVRDDGQGAEGYNGGFGLLGIRERVQLLGGTLTIETAKGRGFMLRAIISC